MYKRGLVGIGALWLLGAVSALSLGVLTIGKWNEAAGRNKLQDVRMLSMAQMAATLERESQFSMTQWTHQFLTGRVQSERTFEENKQIARLRLLVQCGKTEKQVEVAWKRTGGQWRAIFWREL